MGGAAPLSTACRRGIALRAPPGSLFSPGAAWEDFTIEFWLYPATLANGETVLSWEGGLRESGTRLPQALRVRLRDRRLVWEFAELFALPRAGAAARAR